MALIADPLNYPSIDSTYYFELLKDLKFYEEKLAKINNQKTDPDLTHEQTLNIIAQTDHFFEGLTDLILEGWEIVNQNKDEFNDILKNYEKFPNWVYGDDPTKAPEKIQALLEKWNTETERKRLNFFLLFRMLSLFYLMTPSQACQLVLNEQKENFEKDL